eukprot:TRINITY_DN49636_c0_g1_i1.p1 TRINITY_DN49636_c0_g1~~TRINITY_DN49636_c0_g1_i1.p1  ORF type:complete len:178 (-),score=34.78 TRINITY_DN49636_c0_g1_i1:156-689(-)
MASSEPHLTEQGRSSTGGGGANNIANAATLMDERLRAAFGAIPAGTNAVAVPVAMLGGIFGATILGAISYRRSAKRLAKLLPPVPHVPAPAGCQGEAVTTMPPPKASEVLTPREIVHLFVVPGIFAAALAGTLGSICRWVLDVDSMDDVARQVRWLCGGGPRPARVSAPEAISPRTE